MDYFKHCPFTLGKVYEFGSYKGRREADQSFIFQVPNNAHRIGAETRYVHPTEFETIEWLFHIDKEGKTGKGEFKKRNDE